MDKHLKALALVYLGTKFVKLDAEVRMLLLLALSSPFTATAMLIC
jgi:hypothetical protein